MNMNHYTFAAIIGILLLALGLLLRNARAGENPASEFSKPVIDIGIVAADLEKSARFYTEAIGFTEIQGFDVSAELGRKIGLIDGHPVHIRVFVLDNGELATRIKLMSFTKEAPGAEPDQSFIHSTLGISYLTLYVKDMKQALQRLRQTNTPLLGESPVQLNERMQLTAVGDPDGNFLELIGPGRD